MAQTKSAESGSKKQDINLLEVPLSKLPNLPIKSKLTGECPVLPFTPFVDITDLFEPVASTSERSGCRITC